MRLLDTETGQFVETQNPEDLVFAILSHTWSVDGEQSYQEVREIQRQLGVPILRGSAATSAFYASLIADFPLKDIRPRAQTISSRTVRLHLSSSPSLPPTPRPNDEQPTQALRTHTLDHPNLSAKIKHACAVARKYGYRLLWIDSCCIDKESSSELSEAINSMFRWYSIASVCFAYLEDVRLCCDTHFDAKCEYAPKICLQHDAPAFFGTSKWFRRGWTLQELVAPKDVLFLDATWGTLGTKTSFADIVAKTTGIDAEVLSHQKRLDEVSVAIRMSWASNRETTRVEDRAYSLLGIFNIHMPIIYGEEDHAFIRLQKEIMQTIPDQTLFVWGHLETLLPDQTTSVSLRLEDSVAHGLLPRSPTDFLPMKWAKLRPISHKELASRLGRQDLRVHSYSFNSDGVHMSLPIIPIPMAQILPRGVTCNLWHHSVDSEAPGPKPEAGGCVSPNVNIPCLAILACEAGCMLGSLLALPCCMKTAEGEDIGTQMSSVYGQRIHDIDEQMTAYVLSPPLVTRLRTTPGLRVIPISIPLVEPERDNDNPCAAWRKTIYEPDFRSFSPHLSPVPILQNRRALEDAGYTVTNGHNDLIRARVWPPALWSYTLLVELSKGSFRIQTRLATRGESPTCNNRGGVCCAIHVDVGTHLDVADLSSSSDLQRVFYCFTPIVCESPKVGQWRRPFDTRVSYELLVPLDDTKLGSGYMVTLRIALSWHDRLGKWLFTLDVFGLTDELLRQLEDDTDTDTDTMST